MLYTEDNKAQKRKKYWHTLSGLRFACWTTIMMSVLEMIAIGFDMCEKDYVCLAIQKIFSYEYANAVPVVAIMWGVESVPLTFLITQSERKCYGVRLLDLILAIDDKFIRYLLPITVVLQLAFLMISAAYEKEILFFCVALSSIVYIVFTFYLVAVSLSWNAITNIALEQNESRKRGKRWLLADVIGYIDNADVKEVEDFREFIEANVIALGLKHCEYEKRKSLYDLFMCILDMKNRENAQRIIGEAEYADKNYECKQIVLYALLSCREADFYDLALNLLERWEPRPDGADEDKENWYDLYYQSYLWMLHQYLFSLTREEYYRSRWYMKKLKREMHRYGLDILDHPIGQNNKKQFNEKIDRSCQDAVLLLDVKKNEIAYGNIIKNILFEG